MSRRTLGLLLALNLVLAAALAALVWAPEPAQAQPVRGARYSMITGATQQRAGHDLVYVVDWNAARAAAFYFDAQNNQVVVVGDTVLRTAPGAVPGAATDRPAR